MKLLFPAALAATALIPADGAEVATRYTAGEAYTVRREVSETRTSEREMLRDGEPMDRGGFGGEGGGGTTRESLIEYTDLVLEVGEGPTKLRRTYGDLASSMLVAAGGEDLERAMESPFEELVLELTAGDGGVEVEVVEGDEPDEERLADLRLDLFIDGLLPGVEVDVDDTWEIDADAIAAALGSSLERQLFQAPEVDEEAGGRGSRGGRGGRGGFGGGRGDQEPVQFEWTGTATVTELEAEHEGRPVIAIGLELEANGDLPEVQFGGGGGRGGRGGGGGGGNAFGSGSAVERVLDNTYTHELEGQLLFDPELGLPVLLELSGTLTTERYIERDRGDTLIEITANTSSEVDHVITIEPTTVEED